jgi:predicted DNA-binding WGR domain protein
MLANVKTVRGIVQTLCNLESSGLYRRQWADKAVDATKRNMAFRFWDETEADAVAKRLQATLKRKGYKNKVKRTDVDRDYMSRTEGGHYVRVQALFE